MRRDQVYLMYCNLDHSLSEQNFQDMKNFLIFFLILSVSISCSEDDTPSPIALDTPSWIQGIWSDEFNVMNVQATEDDMSISVPDFGVTFESIKDYVNNQLGPENFEEVTGISSGRAVYELRFNLDGNEVYYQFIVLSNSTMEFRNKVNDVWITLGELQKQ